MHTHQGAIDRQANITLNPVYTLGYGAQIGGEGMLGLGVIGSTVRYHLRRTHGLTVPHKRLQGCDHDPDV